jgi:periplasmic protein TonB
MRQGGEKPRHIQNFSISAVAHTLIILLAVIIPNWGNFRSPKKPEHKIYTFDLIDPSMLSMKMTSGASLSSTAKTTASQPNKDTVKVKKEEPKKKKEEPKKEEPKKKEPPKKKEEPKKKDKKAEKKPPKEKPVFSKKSMEERIKEQLKKIEEESKESQWVEPEKVADLLKPASQGKVAEQGIAGLLNTGDFNNINYNDAVASLIYQAWQPPSKTPVDKENVTVVVRFKIAKDGAVSNPRVEKKSGSEVLDTSAIQAIKDSSPLPPLPDDYAGDSLEVCMTFVPVPEE